MLAMKVSRTVNVKVRFLLVLVGAPDTEMFKTLYCVKEYKE